MFGTVMNRCCFLFQRTRCVRRFLRHMFRSEISEFASVDSKCKGLRSSKPAAISKSLMATYFPMLVIDFCCVDVMLFMISQTISRAF